MITLEAVAHYQRCGDGPADSWAAARLNQQVNDGAILPTWSVLGEWQAGWVQVVLFTYRFTLAEPVSGDLPHDVAVALALNLAESIVGESDVQVLGVRLVPDGSTSGANTVAALRNREGSQQ